MTHVFATNLPTRLFLVETLGQSVTVGTQTNNYIAFDGPQASDLRSSSSAGHGANSYVEGGASRRGAIVRQLAVVQVTLEDDQIGF